MNLFYVIPSLIDTFKFAKFYSLKCEYLTLSLLLQSNIIVAKYRIIFIYKESLFLLFWVTYQLSYMLNIGSHCVL
jgi:hypothetical protein